LRWKRLPKSSAGSDVRVARRIYARFSPKHLGRAAESLELNRVALFGSHEPRNMNAGGTLSAQTPARPEENVVKSTLTVAHRHFDEIFDNLLSAEHAKAPQEERELTAPARSQLKYNPFQGRGSGGSKVH